jgi:tellurite resistance protein TehA-like permease
MSSSLLAPAVKTPGWAMPQSGLREIIRQFTPNWFTVTMGTGILALALNQFPIPIPGLHAVGTGLWVLNILLFVAISGL